MHYSHGLKEDEAELGPFRPVRAASRDFARAEQVGLHYHHALELNLFHAASGEAWVGGRHIDLAGQTVVVIPPDAPHAYHIGEGGRVDVVHVSCTDFRALFSDTWQEALLLRNEDWLQAIPVIHEAYAGLEEPIRRLTARSPDTAGSGPLLAAACIEPVCAILDCLQRCAPGRPADLTSNDHMRRIIAYSEEHWHRPVSLAEVAEAACISVPHLCRVFKAAAGISYVDYLSRLRIEKACIMLRAGQPVTEVCYAAGFGNLSYFIQVFKRCAGVTPGQYLKGRRRDNA